MTRNAVTDVVKSCEAIRQLIEAVSSGRYEVREVVGVASGQTFQFFEQNSLRGLLKSFDGDR